MSKYIYIMESAKGLYKIGVSSDPQQRLKSVQTGSGDKVNLVFTYLTGEPFYYEKLMHRKFADNQVLGEWFKFKDKGFIKELIGILIQDSIEVKVVKKASLGYIAEYLENRSIVRTRDIPRPNNESDMTVADQLKQLGCVKRHLNVGQFWTTPKGKVNGIDTKQPKEFLLIYKSQQTTKEELE